MSNNLQFLLVLVLAVTGCTDKRSDPIQTRLSQLNAPDLRKHVNALTDIGPRAVTNIDAVEKTVEYIQTKLTGYGYKVLLETIETDSINDNYSFVNVIAERRGREQPNRVLEIGAHFDTVENSPGADDNASGIAALLEIARIFSTVNSARTIRFCFFAEEETGTMGSSYHVNKLLQNKENIDGAIILEMVGYATNDPDTQKTPLRIPLIFSPPRTGNFIAVIGNFRSGSLGNLFETNVEDYAPDLNYFSANRLGGFFKDALRSDHKHYWEHGYKAIMLTDTADFRNPHYHKASDTADTLNYDFLLQVTRSTAASAMTWSM